MVGLKYLLSAIDARAINVTSEDKKKARLNWRGEELKKVLQEACEGIEDKANSVAEFTDTLERIVNEIRNTTEHSGAFLNKVRKSEVPDYYDVIKNPMDLGTLLKKVKSGAYHSKKAFADDLDLIWSNCLIYNSHPQHPLRKSAEILRAKSNQLLEFISDPAIARRSLLPAQLARVKGKDKEGTPDLGDDDDYNGESEADDHELRSSKLKALRNGVVKPGSPGTSGSPADEEKPSAGPKVVPFEEQPALVRSSTGMADLSVLDATLARIETSKAWRLPPVASTSSASLHLPPPVLLHASSDQHEHVATNGHARPPKSRKLAKAVRKATAIAQCSTNATKQADFDTPEALWWNAVASPVGAISTIPACPFENERQPSPSKILVKRQRRGGLASVMQRNFASLRDVKRLHRQIAASSARTASDPDAPPLGAAIDSDVSDVEPADEEHPRSNDHSDIKRAEPAFDETGVSLDLFKTHKASEAACETLRVSTSRILAHSGFDATASTPLSTLSQLAASYIMNLGRTMRVYSDRWSYKFTPSELLCHSLEENGVPDPGFLSHWVEHDVVRHGQKLADLRAKLEKARKDQVEHLDAGEGGDEILFARDGEAFVTGAFAPVLGEDYFGVVDLGLDREVDTATLAVPPRLVRDRPAQGMNGSTNSDPEDVDETRSRTATNALTKYPLAPSFVPLTKDAIDAQIGLLKPFYLARAEQTDLGLTDDLLQPVKPKVGRMKVPISGRIPIKGASKRNKLEDGTGSGGAGAGAQKKRKKAAAAAAAAAAASVVNPSADVIMSEL